MSRPLRIEYKNAWYHVMNRGRRDDNIFSEESDYIRFKALLKESTQLWKVNICAYCLMPNHYHLLLQTPKANLSRFMRHVNGVYTQRYNRHHEVDGQLFKGRYKSILVGEENYLLELVRYISFNPVNAGLVKAPEKYQWSSYQSYFSKPGGDEWLKKDLVLDLIKGKRKLKKDIISLIGSDASEDLYEFFSKKNIPSVLGSGEFVEKVRNDFFRKMVHSEIPESKKQNADVQKIIKEVHTHFRIPKKELFVQRRGIRNMPRDIVLYFTRTETGKTLSEIAKIFGIENYSSVSSSIERLKKRMQSDKKLSKTIKAIKTRLN